MLVESLSASFMGWWAGTEMFLCVGFDGCSFVKSIVDGCSSTGLRALLVGLVRVFVWFSFLGIDGCCFCSVLRFLMLLDFFAFAVDSLSRRSGFGSLVRTFGLWRALVSSAFSRRAPSNGRLDLRSAPGTCGGPMRTS